MADKYGVLIQTTFELAKFEEILAALKKERPGEYKVEKLFAWQRLNDKMQP